MARNLSASERSSLVRLASGLPVGSPQRKAILAGLSKVSSAEIREQNSSERQRYMGDYDFEDESDGVEKGPLIAYIDLSKAAGDKILEQIPPLGRRDYSKEYGPPSRAVLSGGSTGLFFDLTSDRMEREGEESQFHLDTDLDHAEALIMMKKAIRDLTQGKIPPGFERNN